ncbi:hypothetical protein [Arthrobacter sp. S39]|uniref:hypothetical protein n=1 Tax=Arthrobacter sp. S39 TaxID=2509720 RepID=UPI001F5F6B28|nr:hypothetical protein [Arthrobacter sp. S39]
MAAVESLNLLGGMLSTAGRVRYQPGRTLFVDSTVGARVYVLRGFESCTQAKVMDNC